MRDEILKAEQHLLKILNFNLENIYEVEYKLMVAYLNQCKFLSSKASQIALGIFNDSYFILAEEEYKVEYRIPFSVLLACKIHQTKYDPKNDMKKEEQEILVKFADQEKFLERFQTFCDEILKYYSEIEGQT